MKVIDEGKGKTTWSKRFVCTECDAVLEVEEGDLYAVNTAVAHACEPRSGIIVLSTRQVVVGQHSCERISFPPLSIPRCIN